MGRGVSEHQNISGDSNDTRRSTGEGKEGEKEKKKKRGGGGRRKSVGTLAAKLEAALFGKKTPVNDVLKAVT